MDHYETEQVVPYPWSKSLTDKGAALFSLTLFSPLFLLAFCVMTVTMILSRRQRGRWFYRERRLSAGREFDILKFRVVREDVLAKMPADDQHAREFEDDATNLTWAGRYLLKPWYLDEVPQLLNILKGDMSLVGPRPWPLSMAREQIESGLVYRNLIRAGWTGLAQLQKGKRQSPGEHSKTSAELDLEYVDRCRNSSWWRLWLFDLGVLYRTVRVVFEGRGLKY